MEYQIKCSACGEPSPNMLDFKCNHCNQALDIDLGFGFKSGRVQKHNYSVWRYSDFFPYIKKERIVTLGEGWTPLVRFSRNTFFKLESLNPTGSFKDRGSTVLISALYEFLERTKSCISEDSSGNAGASIAAYAARAGLRARIYVPESGSGPKLSQIRSYGAELVKVPGDRSKATEEAQKTAKKTFYVGHILHPIFRDGMRSLAYEIAEQLAWRLPDRIYLPVSAGTLLLGILHGFQHLFQSGIVETVPTVVACQTTQVSPLYHLFKGSTYTPPLKITSMADALASTNPPLLSLMASRLRKSKGDVVAVEEDEIRDAFKELAESGFFVEPSSAVAYAAFKRHVDSREISKDADVIIIVTGMGLKTISKPN